MRTAEPLSAAGRGLRDRIVAHLEASGFDTNGSLSIDQSRRSLQNVQASFREMQMRESPKALLDGADAARRHSLDGSDISAGAIRPEIREVRPGTVEERLFRWWNLAWWSVPYQPACGRQMRFLIWDSGNGAPMGLTCLNSPILCMAARDGFLGIPAADRSYWVNMSMNAHRVGALPPYNRLLGGKLAALSLVCNEIRDTFEKRYAAGRTARRPPLLLFVVALGAFGKSPMYERLRYGGSVVARNIGHTAGFGTFHLPDALVREIFTMMRERGIDTRISFERGRSQKVMLLKKGLAMLGLGGFHRHGVRRAVYMFEVASNLRDLIAGRADGPIWPDRPFDDLAGFWLRRWALPRHERMPEWRSFKAGRFIDGVMSKLEA